MAEDEAARISQRTREALAAVKRRGVRLGTHDPRCVLLTTNAGRRGGLRGAEANRRLAVVADAGVAALAGRLRAAGLGYRRIAEELNGAGHVTRSGCAWSGRQVQRVLARVVR